MGRRNPGNASSKTRERIVAAEHAIIIKEDGAKRTRWANARNLARAKTPCFNRAIDPSAVRVG
jgi:hypothetical protein